jgi:hypothetical protein
VRLFDLDDLATVGQEDEWLLTSGGDHYFATQQWSDTIRDWIPGADGIAWRPRFGRPKIAVVIYEELKGVDCAFEEIDSEELLVGSTRLIVDDCLRARSTIIK